MIILTKRCIPKNSISYGVLYEGCGNPEIGHDIVGIEWYDKDGNTIHSIGMEENKVDRVEDFR